MAVGQAHVYGYVLFSPVTGQDRTHKARRSSTLWCSMTLTRAPGRASSGVMLLALPFHYFLLHKRVVVRSLLLAFQPLHVAIGKDMPARLATLILQLVDSEGVVSSESYRIPTRYTHEQLASMIGCKRVAVSRAFSRLKVAGAVQLKERHIIVKNLDALEDLAKAG
jgi:Crp-like helix-turn-helix domain